MEKAEKVEITPELEKSIFDLIDKRLESIKSEIESDRGYSLDWDRYITYSEYLKKYIVKLNVRITTKFMEISEVCAHIDTEEVLDWLEYETRKEIPKDIKSLEELPEDLYQIAMNIADRLHDICVEEQLDEINSEYALWGSIDIKSDYVWIVSNTYECDSDYCSVGGELEITIMGVDQYTVEKALDIIEYVVYLYLEL